MRSSWLHYVFCWAVMLGMFAAYLAGRILWGERE